MRERQSEVEVGRGGAPPLPPLPPLHTIPFFLHLCSSPPRLATRQNGTLARRERVRERAGPCSAWRRNRRAAGRAGAARGERRRERRGRQSPPAPAWAPDCLSEAAACRSVLLPAPTRPAQRPRPSPILEKSGRRAVPPPPVGRAPAEGDADGCDPPPRRAFAAQEPRLPCLPPLGSARPRPPGVCAWTSKREHVKGPVRHALAAETGGVCLRSRRFGAAAAGAGLRGPAAPGPRPATRVPRPRAAPGLHARPVWLEDGRVCVCARLPPGDSTSPLTNPIAHAPSPPPPLPTLSSLPLHNRAASAPRP